MKLDFIKDLRKMYNLPPQDIVFEFIKILEEEFNLGDVYFRGDRLYERYINKDGICKDRKLRLTKKNILKLSDKLKERLIQIDLQLKKQYIKKELGHLRVIKGEIIGADNYCFYINSYDLKNCQILLPKDKFYCHNNWEIGEDNYFFVRKIKIKNHSIVIYVDDFNTNIQRYGIINFLSGIYVKDIKFFRNKIIIKSIPKLNDELKDILKQIYNKKIISV